MITRRFRRLAAVFAVTVLALMFFSCAAAGVQGGGAQTTYVQDDGQRAAVAEQDTPAPPPAAQRPAQQVAVIMRGTEPTGLRGARKAFSSQLISALAESKDYVAVDRTEEVQEIVAKEHVYTRSGAVADDEIRELGKQLGVEYVCTVEVSEVMDSYLFEARLTHTETMAVPHSASETYAVRNAAQLMEAVNDTVRKFMRGANR